MSSRSGSGQPTLLSLETTWPQYPSPLQPICRCPTVQMQQKKPSSEWWTKIQICSEKLGEFLSTASKLLTNLNFVLVFQQRCFHDVLQCEGTRLHLKRVPSQVCDVVPVSPRHRFVCHHLKQRAGLTKIINCPLQV